MKRNFFPEFREKEAKPSETVCVLLSFALKLNFFRSEIGTPYFQMFKSFGVYNRFSSAIASVINILQNTVEPAKFNNWVALSAFTATSSFM